LQTPFTDFDRDDRKTKVMKGVVDLTEKLGGLPFRVLRPPNLKLKTLKNWEDLQPSAWTVFALVFLSYFLVSSGIIYDIIVEPPSIGSHQDPATGSVKPVVFLQYRINGQYIIEGLSAGMLFLIGGTGFIIMDLSNSKGLSENMKSILIVIGIVCILISYNLVTLFFRMKLPNYLKWIHFETFFSYKIRNIHSFSDIKSFILICLFNIRNIE